jgi:hypothetical protein
MLACMTNKKRLTSVAAHTLDTFDALAQGLSEAGLLLNVDVSRQAVYGVVEQRNGS